MSLGPDWTPGERVILDSGRFGTIAAYRERVDLTVKLDDGASVAMSLPEAAERLTKMTEQEPDQQEEP